MTNLRHLFLALSVLPILATAQYDRPVTVHINHFEFSRPSEGIWRQASVPGTAQSDLLLLRLIPDPDIAGQETAVQWIGNETWHYRTSFISDSLKNFEHLDLVFASLDTHADVYIDGKHILQTHNMFRSYSVPLTSELRQGKHNLLIVFHPAALHDSLAAKGYGTKLPDSRTFSRKPGYQYGWDWGPRLITCGITGPVTIEGWNSLKILSRQVTVRKIETTRADMTAELELFSGKDQTLSLHYHIDQTTIDTNRTIFLRKGKNLVTIPFSVNNPHLWWPNGYGEPFLYRMVIEPESDINNFEIPFGIRTAELITKSDTPGKSFYFRINGQAIFAKGGNYIPQDNFITRPTDEQYRKLLTKLARQGFNMVRVWGGGLYERDIFYNLCDSLGIMVWQDFMFACYFQPATPELVNEITLEAEEQVCRLRPHPSLVLWCGNNEIDEAWHNWGYQNLFGYSASDTARVWGDYHKIFNELLPGVLKKFDPGRPWWPSSPSIGWGRKESLLSGDMHYWGVWWGNEPFEIYRQKTGRFMSEYGFQSYPHPATISQWAGDHDSLTPQSPLIKAHQKHPTGAETIETYLKRDFNLPGNFDQYVYLSQVLQARGMAIAIESHRLAAPRCMGTLFWQINDCWPAVSWSAIDYYGRPKAFFFHLKHLFAPTLLAASVRSDTLWIEAVTDLVPRDSLTLRTEVWSVKGEKVSSTSTPISLDRNRGKILQKTPVKNIASGADTSRLFMRCFLTDSHKKELSRCRTFFCRPKNMEHNNPQIRTSITQKGKYTYEVTLTASQPAFDVFLTVADDSRAEFSDNFVDVMPGEEVRIELKSELTEDLLKQKLNTTSWIDRNNY